MGYIKKELGFGLTSKEFTSNWCTRIRNNGIKTFPDDFLSNCETEEIQLLNKPLIIGNEFFGHHEILTTDGTSVMQVESHDKAKYLVYASRYKPGKVLIPKSEKEIKAAISNYHQYLEEIISQIKSDYNKNFPSSKNSNETVNEIFRILNIIKY